jgi:thymidylate synthase (FAD)
VTDFYTPENWRKQSLNNKQASEGSIGDQNKANEIFENTMNTLLSSYNQLLELGIAKEQARILLPLNQYSEIYWTASFQAIMNFIELRDEEHAQWEIRQYAIAMKEMMQELFPETTKIWMEVYTTMNALMETGKTIK